MGGVKECGKDLFNLLHYKLKPFSIKAETIQLPNFHLNLILGLLPVNRVDNRVTFVLWDQNGHMLDGGRRLGLNFRIVARIPTSDVSMMTSIKEGEFGSLEAEVVKIMLELISRDILLGKHADNKEEAILQIANDLIDKELVFEGYGAGMLAREKQNSTYLGNGIAIPHGTLETRDLVKQTGIQIHHFANGVDWGDGNVVYLAIGIAAKSDEHLSILKQLTRVLSEDGVEEALKKAKTTEDVLLVLTGKKSKGLRFDETLIMLNSPVSDLISLIALAAGKMKHAGTVSNEFVTALLDSSPTFLSQGLWVASSGQGVMQTAISYLCVATPFEHQGKEVKAILVVAASGSEYRDILNNVSTLISNNTISSLFSQVSADDVINALSVLHRPGLRQIFKIKNAHGLHARPGATLVNSIKPFESKVWVTNLHGDGKQVNAKSLMKVIAMGVKQGHELEFVADGVDAKEALQAIGNAIDSGLGEG